MKLEGIGHTAGGAPVVYLDCGNYSIQATRTAPLGELGAWDVACISYRGPERSGGVAGVRTVQPGTQSHTNLCNAALAAAQAHQLLRRFTLGARAS